VAATPATGEAARLDYLLSAFGPVEGLSRVLRGSGECGVIDWTLLSFSIPEWTLATFIALSVWAVFLALRDKGNHQTETDSPAAPTAQARLR
jgi:disulfide bond formation protein DsbB